MKIYISYSPEDIEAYKELAKKLQAQGDIVINEELPANSEGQEDNTAEKIKEADIVISVVSENYDQSPLEKSPNKSDSKPEREFKSIYGIAIALILALFAIGAFLWMKRNRSSQDSPFSENLIESESEKETEIDEAAVGNTATTGAEMSYETAAIEEQPSESEDKIESKPEEKAKVNQTAVKNTVTIEADIPSDAVSFKGHSYYIFDNNRSSWDAAKEYCESQGGYLAVINSSEENEFLYDYMIDAGFDEVFFGYTDQVYEGYWEWVSDKTSDFTDWGTNSSGSKQPNSDSIYENYAHMNSAMHDGHWNDKRFGKTTSCYFCEWDYIGYQGADHNGKVARNEVPLRSDASSESDIIVKLKKNEEVEILFLVENDDGDKWYYVQNKADLNGYIKSTLLKTN